MMHQTSAAVSIHNNIVGKRLVEGVLFEVNKGKAALQFSLLPQKIT